MRVNSTKKEPGVNFEYTEEMAIGSVPEKQIADYLKRFPDGHVVGYGNQTSRSSNVAALDEVRPSLISNMSEFGIIDNERELYSSCHECRELAPLNCNAFPLRKLGVQNTPAPRALPPPPFENPSSRPATRARA